jgi:DNA polymerase/3'-5' exonuclease PolX
MILSQARQIAEKYKALLAPYCERIEIAGSIRREKPEVGDIEIVTIPSNRHAREYVGLVNQWIKIIGDSTGKYTRRKLPEGIYLDLFRATLKNWGLIFAIRTGSAEYSRQVLAAGWAKKGYESKGGILWKDGRATLILEEEDLFKLLDLPFVLPPMRKI